MCRREDYDRFTALWREIHAESGADTIDLRLHGERLDAKTRARRLHDAPFDDLPDGAFVLHGGMPKLVLGKALLRWSVAGYGPREPRPGGQATLITPPSLAVVLEAGWTPATVPFLHPSADRGEQPE